ncbi:VOC family protein [Nocardia nova]|uniref:VOC family protein n=1 Tax=Nocardia nova TaxID=37330 RepID=UPI0033C85622
MTTTQSRDIDYLDHAVILTTDLDGLAARYADLGFTLGPYSAHLLAPEPGAEPIASNTANRCVLFGETYLELLGIVDDSAPDPWRVGPVAAQREGLRGLVFGCGDADVVARRLESRHLAAGGVLALEREVDTVDGPRTMAARSVHATHRSGGWLGVAQQLTPRYLHQPRYLTHANGAVGLDSVVLVVDDERLADEVRCYTELLDVAPRVESGRHHFDLRAGRVELVAASAFTGDSRAGLPSFAVARITVANPAAARELVRGNGIRTHDRPGGFAVDAADAFGVCLEFVA